MARGTGSFNGGELRAARVQQGLSAERLARLVGTTKSMVLAYENGRTIPEAGRVTALAEALRLPPRRLVVGRTVRSELRMVKAAEELGTSPEIVQVLLGVEVMSMGRFRLMHPPGTESLSDIRQAAGLTVAVAANRAGISASSYRAIEVDGRLPARGYGRFPARLAEALGAATYAVTAAVRSHPAVLERLLRASALFRSLFLMVEEDPLFMTTTHSPEALHMAQIIRQPVGLLSRGINFELSNYRALRRRHAEATAVVQYPRNRIIVPRNVKNLDRLARQLVHAPERAAESLYWSLTQSFTARQWRSLANVMESISSQARPHFPYVLPPELELEPALRYRRPSSGQPLLVADRTGPDPSYGLTSEIVHFYVIQRPLYLFLYPRVAAPEIPLSQRKLISTRRPV
ncbi:helix-turn-helix domain-containing protein [Streptomyces sp. NPDC059255]|uniref:helix-turn-helix domain-containing protein n=1 Tax=Streptomyces sp. NPDC059255 TaxID=3346793 RepID=UPI003693BF98